MNTEVQTMPQKVNKTKIPATISKSYAELGRKGHKLTRKDMSKGGKNSWLARLRRAQEAEAAKGKVPA